MVLVLKGRNENGSDNNATTNPRAMAQRLVSCKHCNQAPNHSAGSYVCVASQSERVGDGMIVMAFRDAEGIKHKLASDDPLHEKSQAQLFRLIVESTHIHPVKPILVEVAK